MRKLYFSAKVKILLPADCGSKIFLSSAPSLCNATQFTKCSACCTALGMQQQSRTFRFTCPQAQVPAAKELLEAQGFSFEELPFYREAMLLLKEPLPLGSSLAARFGYIYIQDASSMLPALALADIIGQKAGSAGRSDRPDPFCSTVLDMCSSPGGKSSLLARELLPAGGFVLANEPGVKRLATLRRNLESMNLLNSGVCSFPGEAFPLPSAGTGIPVEPAGLDVPGEQDEQGGFVFPGWDYILLDPPCSGWGTVDKNPQVMSLWQGDKLKPLVGLQKMLLREAVRLLRPGGSLVYSTCTVNVQENEEQIRAALTELDAEVGGGALSLVPLRPYAGFVFDQPEPSPATGAPSCEGVLRVSMESPLGQGFFIAALQKSVSAAPLTPAVKRRNTSGPAAKAGRRASGAGAASRETLTIPGAAIAAPLTDPSLLPPGELFLQKGSLVFRHHAALNILPEAFNWSGFPIGKAPAPGARPRPDTGLRALMPPPAEAEANGAAVLNLEEPGPILALLSGQSLPFSGGQTEAGLYFRDLPLCRLKARNGRVFI